MNVLYQRLLSVGAAGSGGAAASCAYSRLRRIACIAPTRSSTCRVRSWSHVMVIFSSGIRVTHQRPIPPPAGSVVGASDLAALRGLVRGGLSGLGCEPLDAGCAALSSTLAAGV